MTERHILMVLLYMLCAMPVFVWGLLWAAGMLGDVSEGTFRTVFYVLGGLVLVLVMFVMPAFVLPRVLRGQGDRKSPDDPDPGRGGEA